MTTKARGPVPAPGTGHSETSRHQQAAPDEHSAPRRPAEPFDDAAWERAAAQRHLDRATRLVAGALADQATRDGLVRVTAAELAGVTCLGVVAVDTALSVLASHGLLGRRADRVLVLVAPQGGVE